MGGYDTHLPSAVRAEDLQRVSTLDLVYVGPGPGGLVG